MLSILDLFSRRHTVLTAERIAESLGLARTTCYRYTRELSQAGLLVSHEGLFMLGPRIIELDRRIVESDPLLNEGQPVVSKLAGSLHAIGLLSTSYDDQIITIYEHRGRGHEDIVFFGRGTRLPLFRTSTSKVILANLSRGRLKRIWTEHQHEPDCRAIGSDWLSFWKQLQVIRATGYWSSTGEGKLGLSGVSAPVFFGNGEVAGAITVLFTAPDFSAHDPDQLGIRVEKAAHALSDSLVDRFGPKTGRIEALGRSAKRAGGRRPLVV